LKELRDIKESERELNRKRREVERYLLKIDERKRNDR